MVKLAIMTLADSIVFLNYLKNKNSKILVLINCINDALIITKGVSEIQSVNFGGIRTREGSRLISKAIAITDDDIPVIKLMIDKGLELEIRQVPTDKKLFVKNLI